MQFALLCAVVTGASVRGLLPGLLACVTFVPLMLHLSGERRVARGAVLVGVANSGLLTVGFEGALPVLPWTFPAALALAAPAAAAPGVLTPLIRRHISPSAVVWAVPLVWIAAEFVAGRRWLWGAGASPVALGYTQLDSPLLHLASIAGVTGVGLAVLLANASIAHALLVRKPWPLLPVVAIVVGSFWLESVTGYEGLSVGPVVGIVQPTIDRDWYEAGTVSRKARSLVWERLVELSTATAGADLLVWPEGAVPLDFSVESLPGRIGQAPLPLPVLLTGAVSEREDSRFNSALVVNNDMANIVFDKLAPVPVGERDMEPGRWLVVTRLSDAWVGPLICLDSVYPTFARRLAGMGADFLVVLSDDSFSGGMATPTLHLRVSIFRAVETGLPLVFASAHGPSAIVSGSGEIIKASSIGKAGVVMAEIPAARPLTPFVLFGEWAGALSVLFSASIGLVCVRREERGKRRGKRGGRR